MTEMCEVDMELRTFVCLNAYVQVDYPKPSWRTQKNLKLCRKVILSIQDTGPGVRS